MIAEAYTTSSQKVDALVKQIEADTLDDAINTLSMPVIVKSKFFALVGSGNERWLISGGE